MVDKSLHLSTYSREWLARVDGVRALHEGRRGAGGITGAWSVPDGFRLWRLARIQGGTQESERRPAEPQGALVAYV